MKKLPIVLVLSGVIVSGLITSCGTSNNDNNIDSTKEFNINFIVDEENYYTLKTKGNEVITLPSEPTKEGYEFDGWYLTKEYNEEFLATSLENKPLESNLNVYAKFDEIIEWTPLKKMINFYVDENVYHQILTLGNETLSLPSAPTKEGYKFDNWYLDNTYQEVFDISYYENHELTDSIDVYAKFFKEIDAVPIKKTITFYVDGKIYHQILTNGYERLSLPEAPKKEGFTFINRYKDTNFKDEFNIGYYSWNELTDSIEVYARFDINLFKVDFVTNGGTPVTSISTNLIQKEPFTTKEGYSFNGWYKEETLINKVSFPLDVTSDLTLYAGWVKDEAEIKPFEINEKGIITKINDTTLKVIDIPNNIDGIDVLELDNELFSNNKVVEEVILPETLTYIGYATFKGATSLRKVEVKGNIKVITSSCFENCTSLKEVILPNSIKNINANSFTNTALTSFVAPTSLETIGNEAFKNVKTLINLNLGNVKKLYRASFEGCDSLKEVVLPDSLIDLNEDFVFFNCKNLEKVTMPKKAVSVTHTLFNDTKLFLDQSNWTNNALYVDNYLIKVDDKYSSSIFKTNEATKVIAGGAINDVIEEVTLNEGLEVISKNAFYTKSKVKKVNIPSSVRKIGYFAFTGTAIYKNQFNVYKDAIYLGNWLIGINSAITNKNNIKNLVIKEGTIGISDGEHLNYSTRGLMETLTLNKELLYIGESAFKNTKITDVKFPSRLKRIESNAFYGTNIKEVILSNSTIVDEKAFSDDTIINRI